MSTAHRTHHYYQPGAALQRAIKLFEDQGLMAYPAPTGYTYDDNKPIIRWISKANALDKSAVAFKEYLGKLQSILSSTLRTATPLGDNADQLNE